MLQVRSSKKKKASNTHIPLPQWIPPHPTILIFKLTYPGGENCGFLQMFAAERVESAINPESELRKAEAALNQRKSLSTDIEEGGEKTCMFDRLTKSECTLPGGLISGKMN